MLMYVWRCLYSARYDVIIAAHQFNGNVLYRCDMGPYGNPRKAGLICLLKVGSYIFVNIGAYI